MIWAQIFYLIVFGICLVIGIYYSEDNFLLLAMFFLVMAKMEELERAIRK